MGTKVNLSTAYHPETNGQTERTNQTLEQYLRSFVNYRQNDWHDLLPFAEFTFNNSIHTSTKQTPFYSNYGYHPKSDFLASTVSVVPAAEDRINALHEIQVQLQVQLSRAKADYKKFADRHRSPAPCYTVNDKVWLSRQNLATSRPSSKLDHRFLGPFKILEKIGTHALKLDLPSTMQIHPVVHVNLVKPFTAPAPNEFRDPPPPPPVVLIANDRA